MPQGGPRLRAEDGKLNRVGGRVRRRRKEMRMQQRSLLGRLADVTDGGWNPTPQEVLRIENGTRTVTDTEVVALAQALECAPGWLLVGGPDEDRLGGSTPARDHAGGKPMGGASRTTSEGTRS